MTLVASGEAKLLVLGALETLVVVSNSGLALSKARHEPVSPAEMGTPTDLRHTAPLAELEALRDFGPIAPEPTSTKADETDETYC